MHFNIECVVELESHDDKVAYMWYYWKCENQHYATKMVAISSLSILSVWYDIVLIGYRYTTVISRVSWTRIYMK